MVGKKITFAEKPPARDTEGIIDKWIFGDKISNKISESAIKRTTIYLPEDLRQQLKVKAIKQETTMTDIIISAVTQYLK